MTPSIADGIRRGVNFGMARAARRNAETRYRFLARARRQGGRILKTLIVVAAAALAVSASAFAQTADTSRGLHRHHARRHPYGYHIAVDHGAQYGSGDVYVREGRPSTPVVPIPGFAWRPAAEQEGVGADLVGPGSSSENPTGQYDVSR